MKSFWDGFAKQANEKDPSWWQKQKGINRASSRGNTGIDQYIADDKLLAARVRKGGIGALKGLGLGLPSGAAIGTVISALSRGKVRPREGAVVGGAFGGGMGAIIGDAHGASQADKEYLAGKGIKSEYWGLKSTFSPEARKKYIDAHNK
jgi:hypothetical protein